MSTRAERKARAQRHGCPKCGERARHFVPPSLGDRGFYICEAKKAHEGDA